MVTFSSIACLPLSRRLRNLMMLGWLWLQVSSCSCSSISSPTGGMEEGGMEVTATPITLTVRVLVTGLVTGAILRPLFCQQRI